MIGSLDSKVVEKFQEFQKKSGKYLDLDIEDVEFENFLLSNEEYFTFIKGRNHYIKKYNIANKGKYPLATGSVKNDSIAYYVKPIDTNDIITQKCISFNKDGDSQVFYRDYKFLMDRHHIAIIPSDLVLARYLYFALISYFKKMKFGWGENVADVPTVSKHSISLPQDYNENYKSIDIQKAIVEFLEFWKINYTDDFRQIVTHQKPILEKIKKALIPATLRYDKTIVNSFNEFTKVKDYDVQLENIIFNNKPFFELVTVTNGSEFPAGYVKRKEVKGDIPLISAGVKKDIMGYIKSLQGNNLDIPEKHYVFNDTKQKWNEVKHYNGKDYYTLTADGEGGNIIKRSVNNYPKGFYTTNVCKTLEFDENVIYDSFFYLSYKYTKYKYNFDFANKANNDNLALINISLPEKYEDFDSIDLQKILVEFWEMILNNMDERFTKFDNIERLTDKVDEAFLYRTFSKIEWR